MAATITKEARRAANLRVLQRLDPLIDDIVGSATHVVLYGFDDSERKWAKRNVEGSLFVVSRRRRPSPLPSSSSSSTTAAAEAAQPRHKLIILNRNSRENLDVPVTARFQMQIRDAYLIFRGDKSAHGHAPFHAKAEAGAAAAAVAGGGGTETLGIWFHDGAEREAVSALLKRIVQDESSKADADADADADENAEGGNGSQVNEAEASSRRSAENESDETAGGRMQSQAQASETMTMADTEAAPAPATEAQTSSSSMDEGAAASALLSPLSLSMSRPKMSTKAAATTPPPTTTTTTTTTTTAQPPQTQHQQQQQHAPLSQQTEGMVLDKKSLQLSLLSLLQDERFLDLIHAQYLKVAKARANRDAGKQQQQD